MWLHGVVSTRPHAPRRRAVRAAIAASVLASSLALVGCGSADEPVAAGTTKTVDVIATEYAFAGDPATSIVAGDTVRFRLRNEGMLTHEMQVLDGDGRLIDRTPRVEPGDDADVVVTFTEPGVYQVICDVDDHLSRGQQASFEVDSP